MKKRFVAVALVGLLMLTGCAQAVQQTEVVVLKVGKADAIIILAEGHALLIDVGEAEDGPKILKFLKERGITALDMMILSHFDKDHVGGAPEVLSGIPIGAVYDADYEHSSGKQYREYVAALDAARVPRYRVSSDLTLTVGPLQLTLMPTARTMALDNDQSLVVSMSDGYHTFLFTGDAEEARIDELLAGSVPTHDVLKMPHHGQTKLNLGELLDAVQPRVALITDSDKKPADNEVLALLAECGVLTYQTRDGDISVVSVEDELSVSQQSGAKK